ncbi:MAG: hypothetical protein ACRD3J_03305, partial [Thermoanaerobaculia bacterium]
MRRLFPYLAIFLIVGDGIVGYLLYQQHQDGSALLTRLHDALEQGQRCTGELAQSRVREQELNARVDGLENSDRVAFERLMDTAMATDDLASAHDALEGFLQKFPNSQYRPQAAAELRKTDAALAEEEETIRTTLAAAKKAPDALAAFAILQGAAAGEVVDG